MAGILTSGNPSSYTPDIPPVTVNEFLAGGGAWRPAALASFMFGYGAVIGSYPTEAQVLQIQVNSAIVKPKLKYNDAAFVATAMIDKATVLTNDDDMYHYLENLRPKWPAYDWKNI
jgi:hypothetical protein